MNFSEWAVLRHCSSAGMARYTKKAQSAVFHAYDVASSSGAQEIRSEHLLVGIVMADQSLSNHLILPSADVIVSAFNANECSEHAHSRPTLSKAARHVISCAAEERERLPRAPSSRRGCGPRCINSAIVAGIASRSRVGA